MPSWTLSDLMSQATARVGFRSDLASSVASFWVNAAYQEVAQAEPGILLESITFSSTTSGNSAITLPADCMEIITVSWYTTAITSGQTLLQKGTMQSDSEVMCAGQPSHYYSFGTYLYLWPSPDSAYSLRLRYFAYPSDMTSTSAVPSLATEWRPAVLYLAEAFLHEYVGNATEAVEARARYAGYAQSLKNAAARRAANRDMRASLPLRQPRYGGSGTGRCPW